MVAVPFRPTETMPHVNPLRRPAAALSWPALSVTALVCLALLGPSAAGARTDSKQQYIEISGASFKPLPLALAPFTGLAEPGAAVAATLREDLEISGLFELLDPASFLANTAAEGLGASTIDFAKWRAVGADSLVKASVSGDAKAPQIDFRLYDVIGGKEALRATYSVAGGDLRAVAHAFADRLYEHFTGEKGIFRTRIAYVRRLGGAKELWVADFDGRNATALTSSGGLNILPSWSPDGKSLAFTSYRSGSPMLHLLDVSSRAVRNLPLRGDLQTGGTFSPDGKRIAFTMSENGNSEIYVMNADGSGLQQLTDNRESDSSPTWSPDGKRIAFVSGRSGGPQIFLMNADGSGVERLTFQGNYNQTPDWSPRGDLIAFTARDERRVFDIFTLDVKTRKIHRLTQDQGDNEEPSFSPNGRHIAFVSTRAGGKKRLWIMNADGTNQRVLPIDGEHGTPAWGPWRE